VPIIGETHEIARTCVQNEQPKRPLFGELMKARPFHGSYKGGIRVFLRLPETSHVSFKYSNRAVSQNQIP